ncbi:hypothetical protein KL86PLE_90483 [uncultured Pleomorphomonas sp.]|uniref:Uncharacterized protein n=1 Tax=uncultured Pleomorphomonas sp. TaxID=442121 RepID=A0A212LQ41_9HYPH|nr:hypothetical protein KL86PLE_90483 [uncultured Pleomorphomonas sp.]
MRAQAENDSLMDTRTSRYSAVSYI